MLQQARRKGEPVASFSLLISGTDTGVGKTTIASGLATALGAAGRRVGVLKPAETGCEPAPNGEPIAADARRLAFFAACEAPPLTICPYRFRDPLAPRVAAEREGRRIDLAKITEAHDRLAVGHDLVLIEGAGGLLVPLCDRFTYADLCRQLNAQLLVVVGNKLGAINHALLTISHVQHIRLRLAGYVINTLSPERDLAAETNVDLLHELLGPPLGVIPWLGDIEETNEERARLAKLFAERVALGRLSPA